MVRYFLIIAVSAWFSMPLLNAQNVEAFRIYNPQGEEVELKDVVDEFSEKDVVFFGELHNNPINHWLQLELTKALDAQRALTLGAEMFERDDQVVLDEYLAGKIKEDHLLKEAKVWPNYKTDYKPLVEYAKENDLSFIATNIPRRYASLVSREGQEGLQSLDGAENFIPELPFEVTADDRGYAEMEKMMGAHGHGMDMSKLVEAQAIKDYTMAQAILGNRTESELFLHYNGSFHSQYRAGIVGYILAEQPDLIVGVIAATEADSLEFQEGWSELGDYVLVTPSSMTKTH